ncbi:3-demethylubiquinone-9 3-methyltransferase [Cohaesibacter sp. ES.047]|uniref:bifunctional 2-polyprenyl-6-hydroxyphenol methylase/3-demethylubiquinol 3-O-methyltransferase UbiG n=1 Tax=Cohaesibacter sp. ES.047 TaxID=1798205 RepID=UPI000BB70E1A|nr:bifunctional 2-polyprenyl-6-hydroxyphenol methylase/3-demethylubiquinol 3-O-methyltransferase UbiG [Cohaesibacter sp. ES.047]SNY92406.1 3-demethylubiquinone-9 3-methyltransferase [Cohaesibacter sp. ES.047]
MTSRPTFSGSTIDEAEVARFSAMAAEWWSPTGKFRPLHKFNPTRVAYIREKLVETFGLDAKSMRPLEGLRILDIGCGGGLLCEPLHRMGADVVGVDASETNIAIASTHAAETGLEIDYRADTAEALAEAGETFDVVLAMEVVEHVADIELFLQSSASMVKPGGLMVVATLNRTLKSHALAIIGAEYILRWLPVGTHSWDKFVTPDELERAMAPSGLDLVERVGVTYNPLTGKWSRSKDLDVNYMELFKRG